MLRDLWQDISNIKQDSGGINYALGLVEATDRLAPSTFPQKIKILLKQAEDLLQSHQMNDKATILRIARAYMSLQTGEEREAIELSENTIFTSINLSSESWAKLIYIMALAYSRMGELEYAYKMVDEYGISSINSIQKKKSWVGTQMFWLKAEILWKIYLLQNYPDLWCGPPTETIKKTANILPVNPSAILDQIKFAKNYATHSEDWPFNEIVRLTLLGMQPEDSLFLGNSKILENIADSYRQINPAVAGWALLGAALLYFKQGKNSKALNNVIQTNRLAQEYQIGILLRITLIYEIHLRELQSDYSGALYAQKSLSVLQHKSVYSAPLTPEKKFSGFAEQKIKKTPKHLQRAIEYIDNNLGKKLNVLLVAEYCQVSRRTLELQFKKYKQTTASEYIKGKRMQAATDFLLKGELPMYKVAEFLGYSSQSVFSREFSRHYGLPPRSWLKNHQRRLD